jgi:hypothetical protein
MNKRTSTLWVALFFAALTLIGLLTSGDYGLPLDGPSEQVILQENMKEYAALLLGEDSDAVKGYDALSIDRITESIEMDHGQAAYYPAAPLLAVKDTNPHLFNTLWHAYTWLWFMAGVLAAYALCRSFGLPKILACAAALTLYLSPRFLAEGHYNNKDIVLLSLTLWTIAAGAQLIRKPDVRRALLFAVAGALAANTRIIGLFVFGVTGITAAVALIARREMNKGTLVSVAAAVVGFAVIYTLITPAFMMNPSGFIRHVLQNAAAFSRWPGVVIFKGARYDPAGGLPLPRSYLPTMIALTVPVPVLALAAIGGVYAVYRCAIGDGRRPALIALLIILAAPALYAVLARPLMYNGWRHFYFLYGPIVVLAGLGMGFLHKLMKNSRAGRIAGAGALALLILYQGIGIALNHPYQYAYYNELAGDVQDQYELDYWELSTLNAMTLLAENGDRDPALPLAIGGGDEMSLFSLNQSAEMLPESLRGAVTVTEEENPPYVFSNATYAIIYGEQPGNGYKALFSIESYGNAVCTVYERLE